MEIASRKGQGILHTVAFCIEFQKGRLLRLTASAPLLQHERLGHGSGNVDADIAFDKRER